MFGHKTIHINLPFSGSRKSKDVEIVGAEISLINSVLDMSIAMYENDETLA